MLVLPSLLCSALGRCGLVGSGVVCPGLSDSRVSLCVLHSHVARGCRHCIGTEAPLQAGGAVCHCEDWWRARTHPHWLRRVLSDRQQQTANWRVVRIQLGRGRRLRKPEDDAERRLDIPQLDTRAAAREVHDFRDVVGSPGSRQDIGNQLGGDLERLRAFSVLPGASDPRGVRHPRRVRAPPPAHGERGSHGSVERHCRTVQEDHGVRRRSGSVPVLRRRDAWLGGRACTVTERAARPASRSSAFPLPVRTWTPN